MALKVLSPMHKAMRQLQIHLGARTEPLGVRAPEGHLLTYLLAYAPCPMGELHRVFGDKKSTLTSVLDRLEERGLATRELCPTDRRSFLVRLTPDGIEAATRVRHIVEQFEADLLARVTERDLEGFHEILRAIGDVTQIGSLREPRAPETPAGE